jgi:hypothetical protein
MKQNRTPKSRRTYRQLVITKNAAISMPWHDIEARNQHFNEKRPRAPITGREAVARIAIMDIVSYALSHVFTLLRVCYNMDASEAHAMLVDMLEQRRTFDIGESRTNRLGGHIKTAHPKLARRLQSAVKA